MERIKRKTGIILRFGSSSKKVKTATGLLKNRSKNEKLFGHLKVQKTYKNNFKRNGGTNKNV